MFSCKYYEISKNFEEQLSLKNTSGGCFYTMKFICMDIFPHPNIANMIIPSLYRMKSYLLQISLVYNNKFTINCRYVHIFEGNF